jgi:hypothetical protein
MVKSFEEKGARVVKASVEKGAREVKVLRGEGPARGVEIFLR